MNEFIVFVIGSLGYCVIEMLWRGYTHWTMAIAGGISFLLIYNVNLRFSSKLLIKCLFSSLCITGVEFVFGILFNLILGLNIWDYSELPYNLFGQISLLYSVMWFFLSIPLIKLCDILKITLEEV